MFNRDLAVLLVTMAIVPTSQKFCVPFPYPNVSTLMAFGGSHPHAHITCIHHVHAHITCTQVSLVTSSGRSREAARSSSSTMVVLIRTLLPPSYRFPS